LFALTRSPYSWNLVSILTAWPPDDVTPRSTLHQGLCVFDFERDYEKAMAYRDAEVPFLTVNDPSVHRTVERWNRPGYLEALLGDEPHRCEYSENNHFMYYIPVSKRRRKMGKAPQDWKPPTKGEKCRPFYFSETAVFPFTRTHSHLPGLCKTKQP